MSVSHWRRLILSIMFVNLLFTVSPDDSIQRIPFCNPQNADDPLASNDLIIVSTLDGKVTAFSMHDGEKAWHLETQPLLSSNLHHVELSSGGKWVRLVPSLRGTLYSLSGDTIEPLPFDAEQLLSSSFKYSDDLVVAGARETLWIGLDLETGSVVYECGSGGCNSEQQAREGARAALVLRRHANTVRALDPRTGLEKWNFSVAEHQLAVSAGRECHPPPRGPVAAATVAVALPEGIVAVRAPDSQIILWQQQLEAPVAGMWRLQSGALQTVDVLWEGSKSLTEHSVVQAPPSLYIGVHNKQLYIQENYLYTTKLEASPSSHRSPFKMKETRPLIGADTALSQVESPPNTLSLIALYGNTGLSENHGFFLYLQDTCDQTVQITDSSTPEQDNFLPNDSDDHMDHHHIHVHVYSLWYWWKEVLLIAISSALLMNLMIWPKFFAPKFRPHTPVPVNQEYIVVERHYERPITVSTSAEYCGRYENDFTPLRCLGRGGFGVVFEARNNIDHCSYAVKRITLPKRESKRERVLREVRALAKLEHEHIVRYFNAWLEEPPPNWQEERDAVWMRELDGVSLTMSDEYTATLPALRKKSPKDSKITLNLHKDIDQCVDALDYEKQLTSKRLRSLSCNDSFSIVFDDEASKHADTGTGDLVSKQLSNTKDSTHVSPKHTSVDDDSFIMFADSKDASKSVSGAKNNPSFNKQLEKVKQSDTISKTDDTNLKKKKGHTRHWSLDMGARSTEDDTAKGGSKMYLYIQMQLCLRDSLHDWLRQNRNCAARGERVKTLFGQIVSAVEYVHLAGLIHRDLKPSNIFFAPDGRVKVGDFGLVTTMADGTLEPPSTGMDAHARHTYRVGTHLYMSPEQLAGRAYSYKVDIYSLGLILLELLQPFQTEAERVSTLLRARDGQYSQEFLDLYPNESEVLKLMLCSEPDARPTAAGVRARAPLYERTDRRWHFTLPTTPAA